MKFRVFDSDGKKDITDEYEWVMCPDGSVCILEDCDLIGMTPKPIVITEYDDVIIDLYKTLSQICDNIRKHDLSFTRVTGAGAPERVAPIFYALGRIEDKYESILNEVFNHTKFDNKN